MGIYSSWLRVYVNTHRKYIFNNMINRIVSNLQHFFTLMWYLVKPTFCAGTKSIRILNAFEKQMQNQNCGAVCLLYFWHISVIIYKNKNRKVIIQSKKKLLNCQNEQEVSNYNGQHKLTSKINGNLPNISFR